MVGTTLFYDEQIRKFDMLEVDKDFKSDCLRSWQFPKS